MTELSDVFRQQLDTEIQNQSPASTPPRRTAREAVRQCLGDIRRGRKKQVSWDAIAESIQSSAQSAWGISVNLTGETAKRYYYQFTAKKKRKKRSHSTTTTSRKSSAPTPAKTPAQAVQPAASGVTPTPAPAPETVARSPAREPEPAPMPEATNPPAVPKATIPSLHDRLRNTRNPRTPRGYENCKTK